ncbi:serine/threonine-protein kinase [Brasilonema sp. UFV-L1]|uniref:serine/threonine-protein kinase n=1 Tax=Brasilonema sp. UFV-L1 TaxID=2234130 RepID=UPI00145FC7B3|nr:serine/threonine-protein kinase [Brasilonema sp. UFV-L1]NMG07427.1 serine/threonine protein kinase [Brasilonema sp. UFV-L1]
MMVVAMIRPGMLLQGRYRVICQIGGGGFGKVFEVDDGGTPKVLKVLSLERFHNPTIKQKAIALFQREAELLTRFKHPGIPRVESDGYFTWSDGNGEPLHCLVMEKIPGLNLQQWLQERGNQPLTTEQAHEWLIQLIEILNELHQHQYLHRDIKLSNIMLKPDGQLVLIDFGAVREVTNSYLEKQQGKHTGTVLVSPGFTPPEQAEGHAVPQSDFFALGRTFVYLLTGKSPLDFPKNSETGELIWREQAPSVSPQLANLIERLIAPFPGQRPQNCQTILNYLKGNQQLEPLSQYGTDTLPPDTEIGVNSLALNSLLKNTFSLVFKSDKKVVDRPNKIQDKLSKKKRFQFWLAGLLVLGTGGINLWKTTPEIAFNLNNLGFTKYQEKSFDTAKIYYHLAMLINPKMPEPQYNLGLLYEDENKITQARTAYQMAALNGFDRAYNNLARLYILEKQYGVVVPLLQQGLQRAEDDKAKYAMFKNLGWAYLEQGNYQEAQNYLQKAININSERATAYCLQAKVLEKQNNQQGELSALKNCVKYKKSATKEEKQWSDEAATKISKILQSASISQTSRTQ